MLVDGLVPWRFVDPAQFLTYWILAGLAATCRFRMHGISAAHSLAFLVILMGIADLPLPQTLVIGSAAALVQALWKPRNGHRESRAWFHLAACAIGIVFAYDVAHHPWIEAWNNTGLMVLTGAGVFGLVNTGLIAAAAAMVEGKPVGQVSLSWILRAIPYYAAGAATAALSSYLGRSIDWNSALLVVAPMFVIYVCYRQFIERQI